MRGSSDRRDTEEFASGGYPGGYQPVFEKLKDGKVLIVRKFTHLGHENLENPILIILLIIRTIEDSY